MQNRLKISIFAIDDDNNTLLTLQALFKRNGIINYSLYEDPELFLFELHSGVQICIIDYDLKSQTFDGLSLLRAVQKQNPYCMCIIMSGYDDINMVVSFLNADAFRYLMKGEKRFAENIISYIKEAIEKISASYEFYTTILSNMKGVTEELKVVRNG